jgi:hypothetical protein
MTGIEVYDLLVAGPDGIRRWNQLRTGLPKEKLPSLNGYDLHGYNLSEACLDDMLILGSYLNHCKFVGASLRGASLASSILSSANFTDTDLTGAELVRADLVSSKFYNANLSGTVFTGALCGATVFADVDLSTACDLESVVHVGPSHVWLDTLFKSHGRIPDVFLRGCGVPEEMVRHLPGIINAGNTIQFYSCFISYSHKDEEFAQRLHCRLRDKGLRVWYAPEEMKGGRKIHEQIYDAIHVHDKLLLVLSPQSMGSEWVATEIRRARSREVKEKRRVLFPIRLCEFAAIRDWEKFDADTGKDMAAEIREFFVPDFSDWKNHDAFETAFERLLRDLRNSEAGGPAVKPAST